MSRFSCSSLLVALVCCALPASAQQSASLDRINSITVQRENVFDATEHLWWQRFINHLHKTTLEPVVRRELLLHVGDSLDATKLAETERNLRGLHVFRSVRVDTVRSDSGIALHVLTRDGWSTNADFRFRSTGGAVAYTIALIEGNLLGTATVTQLLYKKDPDRTTTILSFRQPRLISGKIGATVLFADRSDGKLFYATVAEPWFSDASAHAVYATIDTRRERILLFRDGNPVATDTVQRRYVLGSLFAGEALRREPGGYLRASLFSQLRRDDYVSQSLYDLLGGIPGHTVTATLGAALEQRRGNWIKVAGYQGFGHSEDIDLGRVLSASVAIAPKLFGYDRNGLAPAIYAQKGLRLGRGFVRGEFAANGMFTSAGLDSGRVAVGLTAALLPSVRHNFIAHAELGIAHRPLPGAEYDLGLGVGPRAFRQHAFTGDRQYFLTAEYRFTLAPDLFKVVGVGLAAFADQGGANWHGSPMRSGTDVGIGLRLGPSRTADQESNRIDIARRFATDREKAGWVIVIGKGFVFGRQ